MVLLLQYTRKFQFCYFDFENPALLFLSRLIIKRGLNFNKKRLSNRDNHIQSKDQKNITLRERNVVQFRKENY